MSPKTGARSSTTPLSWLHGAIWRAIYFVLGAGPGRVLNRRAAEGGSARPDQQLQRAAHEVQAEFVDASGRRVDYGQLRSSDAFDRLRQAAAALRTFSPSSLSTRAARLAFWINLYNALILDAVVSLGVRSKIRPWFFLRAAYNIGGLYFSADHIEHGVLRGNRPHPAFRLRMFPADDPRRALAPSEVDARIHLALNCGASSCPPIEVYEAERIDQQLDLACRSFLNGAGAQVDLQARTLRLSRLFRWYEDDFGGRAGVLEFVARYLKDDDQAQAVAAGELTVEYLPYDWTLNSVL